MLVMLFFLTNNRMKAKINVSFIFIPVQTDINADSDTNIEIYYMSMILNITFGYITSARDNHKKDSVNGALVFKSTIQGNTIEQFL